MLCKKQSARIIINNKQSNLLIKKLTPAPLRPFLKKSTPALLLFSKLLRLRPEAIPTLRLLYTRGEHGQDHGWISYRILAIFSNQDWIWIFILEKNESGQDQDIGLISITKFSRGWFKMSQMMVLHSSQSTVIHVTSSLIFSGQVEVVSCSCIAGMLLCLLC